MGGVALAVTLVALALTPVVASARAATPTARLKTLDKRVTVAKNARPATFKPVKSAAVAAGDTIRTDARGLAELTFHDGSLARIDRNTNFTITKLGSTNSVKTRLAKGQAWNEVTKASGSTTHYQVATPNAVAAVRGTQFAVSCLAPPACTFVVVQGVVAVSDRTGTVDVAAGTQVTVDAGGTLGKVVPLQSSPWIQQNQQLDTHEGRPTTNSTSAANATSATPSPGADGPTATLASTSGIATRVPARR